MTAAPTVATPPRGGAGWLLIGLPVLLLLVNGIATLIEVRALPAATIREVVPITFGALSIVAAVALLARRRLGWLLAVSIVGWHLAATLALWWVGTPEYLPMALVALSAILVTSPDMRRAYAAERTP